MHMFTNIIFSGPIKKQNNLFSILQFSHSSPGLFDTGSIFFVFLFLRLNSSLSLLSTHVAFWTLFCFPFILHFEHCFAPVWFLLHILNLGCIWMVWSCWGFAAYTDLIMTFPVWSCWWFAAYYTDLIMTFPVWSCWWFAAYYTDLIMTFPVWSCWWFAAYLSYYTDLIMTFPLFLCLSSFNHLSAFQSCCFALSHHNKKKKYIYIPLFLWGGGGGRGK